ncbi:glycosyltransferase [Cellulomonas sp.]|uniref:glycosyltransferase n=1 Tax=Cellulomonas sp. TaxID=40001 RepID=UPI003BA8F7A2
MAQPPRPEDAATGRPEPRSDDVGGARPRVFVFLQHGLSLEAWRSSRGGGATHSDSPYEYAVAMAVTDMSWSVDRREALVAERLRRSVRRVLGFDLVHAWRNRRAMGSAQVIWTHTERESLAALAVLWLLRNRTTKVIAQSVWLWDEWSSRSAPLRWLYRALLDRAAVEITLSDANRAIARAERRSEAVYRVPFGIGVNEALADEAIARASGATGGPYVLAVGSDRHRDWATLHSAALLLPDVTFRVATLSTSYPEQDAPRNVRLTPAGTLEVLYDMYARAAAVVLPLRENQHASGCTVALEAQRLGRPLITADTGGIGLYLGDRGVYRYPAGDSAALAERITSVLRERAAGEDPASDSDLLRSRGLTGRDYAARLVMLTRWLLYGTPDPGEAERLAPMRTVLS